MRHAPSSGRRFRTWLTAFIAASVFASILVAPPGGAEETPAAPAGNIGVDAAGLGTGYWMLDDNGDVHAFGDAEHFGNAGFASARGWATLVPTPTGDGYWLLTRIGTLVEKGDAADLGNAWSGQQGLGDFTAAAATSSGQGLWSFTDDGEVVTLGDATHHGDLRTLGVDLNGSIVDAAVTPTGNGYWLLGSEGGIFAFGDATFYGSIQQVVNDLGLNLPAEQWLNAPIVGLVPTPENDGYWLVASDGGIFAFGNAPFRGSVPGVITGPLAKPVNGMVPYGNGYLMVAADGGVFTFSDQPFLGSLGNNPPSKPVIAITPQPSTPPAIFVADIEETLINDADPNAITSYVAGGYAQARRFDDDSIEVLARGADGSGATVRFEGDETLIATDDGYRIRLSRASAGVATYEVTKGGALLERGTYSVPGLASYEVRAAPAASAASDSTVPVAIVTRTARVSRVVLTKGIAEELWEGLLSNPGAIDATADCQLPESVGNISRVTCHADASVNPASRVEVRLLTSAEVPIERRLLARITDPTACAVASGAVSIAGSIAGGATAGPLVAWLTGTAATAGFFAGGWMIALGGAVVGWFLAASSGVDDRCADLKAARAIVNSHSTEGDLRGPIRVCPVIARSVALSFGTGTGTFDESEACIDRTFAPFIEGDRLVDRGKQAGGFLTAVQDAIAPLTVQASSEEGNTCRNDRNVPEVGNVTVEVERTQPSVRGRFSVRVTGGSAPPQGKLITETCSPRIETGNIRQSWSVEASKVATASDGTLDLRELQGQITVTSQADIRCYEATTEVPLNTPCTAGEDVRQTLPVSLSTGTLRLTDQGALAPPTFEVGTADADRGYHIKAPPNAFCSLLGGVISLAAAANRRWCNSGGGPATVAITGAPEEAPGGTSVQIEFDASGGFHLVRGAIFDVQAVVNGNAVASASLRSETRELSGSIDVPLPEAPGPVTIELWLSDQIGMGALATTTVEVLRPPCVGCQPGTFHVTLRTGSSLTVQGACPRGESRPTTRHEFSFVEAIRDSTLRIWQSSQFEHGVWDRQAISYKKRLSDGLVVLYTNISFDDAARLRDEYKAANPGAHFDERTDGGSVSCDEVQNDVAR